MWKGPALRNARVEPIPLTFRARHWFCQTSVGVSLQCTDTALTWQDPCLNILIFDYLQVPCAKPPEKPERSKTFFWWTQTQPKDHLWGFFNFLNFNLATKVNVVIKCCLSEGHCVHITLFKMCRDKIIFKEQIFITACLGKVTLMKGEKNPKPKYSFHQKFQRYSITFNSPSLGQLSPLSSYTE